jgi:hypothetical protein
VYDKRHTWPLLTTSSVAFSGPVRHHLYPHARARSRLGPFTDAPPQENRVVLELTLPRNSGAGNMRVLWGGCIVRPHRKLSGVMMLVSGIGGEKTCDAHGCGE